MPPFFSPSPSCPPFLSLLEQTDSRAYVGTAAAAAYYNCLLLFFLPQHPSAKNGSRPTGEGEEGPRIHTLPPTPSLFLSHSLSSSSPGKKTQSYARNAVGRPRRREGGGDCLSVCLRLAWISREKRLKVESFGVQAGSARSECIHDERGGKSFFMCTGKRSALIVSPRAYNSSFPQKFLSLN